MWKVILPAVLVALAPAAHAVTLKCDTSVTTSDDRQTTGVAYLDIETDPVFATESHIRVLSVTAGHLSLLNDLNCKGGVGCLGDASDTEYSISRNAPNYYLSVEINRTDGTYYATEKVGRPNLLGVYWTVFTETGTCAPGEVPGTLF